MNHDSILLAIESSCDDTSAAVCINGRVVSNIIATQKIHESYGGVVPELASRDHQKNIIPVVHEALKIAGVDKKAVSAVAFTRGPGLMGSLLVGVSFAKGFALAQQIPLIEVHHMQAHILAHFIEDPKPQFPFLCLTVSGGHTQIVLVKNFLEMEVLGKTIDDAAGEAFDKAGKIMGLPYPAGPVIDTLSKTGNNTKFHFPQPKIEGYDFSFSGLKTSLLYFIQKETQKNPHFIEENLADLCASFQQTIIDFLLVKIKRAAKDLGIKHIALAGGVSANSALRNGLEALGKKQGWEVYVPAFQYCTDNAAMIAITGYYKFINKDFVNQEITPLARYSM